MNCQRPTVPAPSALVEKWLSMAGRYASSGGTPSFDSSRAMMGRKLGLAGTAVEAFARTAEEGRPRKVFFVPATINYLITLEAETLIADYLSETGKNRYIIEDDESSRVGRMTAFVRKLLGMEGSVIVRFGEPIDPFGNRVDEHGDSYDSRGRKVEPASYVTNQAGDVTLDATRDAQYTRELGDAICDRYKRDTVAMSTHLVASVCFDRLRKVSPAPAHDDSTGAVPERVSRLRAPSSIMIGSCQR